MSLSIYIRFQISSGIRKTPVVVVVDLSIEVFYVYLLCCTTIVDATTSCRK